MDQHLMCRIHCPLPETYSPYCKLVQSVLGLLVFRPDSYDNEHNQRESWENQLILLAEANII